MSIEYYIAAFNFDPGSNYLPNAGMESNSYWAGSGGLSSYWYSSSVQLYGSKSLGFSTVTTTPGPAWGEYTSNSWWFANNSSAAYGTWNPTSYQWTSGTYDSIWLHDMDGWTEGYRFSAIRLEFYSVGSKQISLSFQTNSSGVLYSTGEDLKYGTGLITAVYSLNWSGIPADSYHLHTVSMLNFPGTFNIRKIEAF